MNTNLSPEMIWVVSRCLSYMNERTLAAFRTGPEGDEVDGIEARDYFRELEDILYGKKRADDTTH